MSDAVEALSRTARLLNEEYFGGAADESAIARGLLATSVRLSADAANLASRAGQAALVTTFLLIARMGIKIELDIPEVELIEIVPPLRRPELRDALLDVGLDLIPGAVVTCARGERELTIVFGDTPCNDSAAVRLLADELSCRAIGADATPSARIAVDWPLGALTGAAAAAPIALDAALPKIEEATGMARERRPRPSPGPPVAIDLTTLFPDLVADACDLGAIDAISGGALTNSFLYTLLWLPGVRAAVRVVEAQDADLSNTNRYMLLRASDAGRAKVDQLSDCSSERVRITGVPALFTHETRAEIVPLARRVIVGVDRIEARWAVQREWPEELCVGATGNHIAEITTHRPGGPCAGCAHPQPLPETEIIPTISFVSFWPGLLQTAHLLAPSVEPMRIMLCPFALGGSAWLQRSSLVAVGACPVGCEASQQRAA